MKRTNKKLVTLLPGLFSVLVSCEQYTVSVNNQPVYDPEGRLASNTIVSAELQGCVNLALRQQSLQNAADLTVLSCANSQLADLENIGQLHNMRFLDLANNNISNITPLEGLLNLGGLNLINNKISDISPLLNIPSLVSVSLLGNNGIPCVQIEALQTRLGSNLTPPELCER